MIPRLKSYLVKVYPFVYPDTKVFWLIVFASVIIAPLGNVGFAMFTKELFDGVAAGDLAQVYFWSSLWLFYVLIIIGLMFGSWYLRTRFTIVLHNRIRRRFIDHILSAEKAHTDQYHSGDLISRLNHDIPNGMGLISNTAINLASNVVMFVGMVTYLLFINPYVIFTSIIGVPLAMHVSKRLGPRLHAIQKAINERNALINQDLQDHLKGIPIVKCYGLAEGSKQKFINNRRFVVTKELERVWVNFLLNLGSSSSLVVANILAVLVAGYLYIAGSLSLGSVMMTIIATGFLVNPLRQIPQTLAQMEAHISSIDRMYEILDLPLELACEHKEAVS